MVKTIDIVYVGSENNEAPKEVEETKEEPIINEESKEVETNNIINEEENKVEEVPKQELKPKTYSTEKVECPKCKKYLTKYTFKYRHNCNGIPVKKEPDPNKVVLRKLCILHKQKNLRITYMKKSKTIFQKWMNKKWKEELKND